MQEILIQDSVDELHRLIRDVKPEYDTKSKVRISANRKTIAFFTYGNSGYEMSESYATEAFMLIILPKWAKLTEHQRKAYYEDVFDYAHGNGDIRNEPVRAMRKWIK